MAASKTFRIRSATAADMDQVRAIYAPFVEESLVTFEVDVPTQDDMDQRRQAIQARAPFLVATAGEVVAGYAYAGAHRTRAAYQWAVESSVYVAPDFRRHQVATHLYEALLSILDAQGFAQVYAGVALPNAASETFHERMGFREVGTYCRVGFKAGRWVDVRWSARALSAAQDPAPPPPERWPTTKVDRRAAAFGWTTPGA